ncbi:MAG TPA: hypothetical protein VGJ78_09240 [Vicinamibacterales bacterium]
MIRTLLLFAAALVLATAAHAQNTPAPTNGPLVLERIHDGWVLAPDIKVTDIDGRTGELAGAYGGRLIDNTLLLGAAAHWLTNDARDFEMAYGGVVVGWQSPEYGRIRFGGRGTAGVGRATLGFDITTERPADIRFGVTNPRLPRTTTTAPGTIRARVIGRDDFLFVEPEANVSARITRLIGVSCGVGYRQTGNADVLRDRLNGPTANLAIQFGW